MNLDAYTIRKIAPRLLLAVIGVNLSIYLCVAAVDITTVIGHGLGQLIRGPFDASGVFDNAKIDQGAGNIAGGALLVLGILVAVPAIKGGALATIFFLLLPVFVLILAILLTLVLRQTLIVLLTLISPLAIVLSVLPGTEKYFKQWWDLFIKTLVVYPIIAALFAVSDVLTAISFTTSNLGGNTTGAADVIFGVMFAFMPLVLIPFAFRFAGGALGAFTNATSGMRSMANRFATGRLQKNYQSGFQKIRSGSLFDSPAINEEGKAHGVRHRLNRFAQGTANLDKLKFTRPIGSMRTAMEGGIIHGLNAVRESDAYKEIDGFDDELFVAATSNGSASDIDRRLIERAGKRFNYMDPKLSDDERAMRRSNLINARNQIQNLHKVNGLQAGRAAAAVGLHGISTSYDTQYALKDGSGPWIEGVHSDDQKSDKVWKTSHQQMQDTILKASGGMEGLGNYITGESLKGAKQAGRYDMAASASAVLLYQEAMRSGDKKVIDKAQDNYEDMMIRRITPAQATQGHPRAAKEVALAWRDRIDKVGGELLQMDPKSSAFDAKQSEMTSLLADVAGFQETLPSSNKDATDAFQKNVMSHKVKGGRQEEATVEELIRSVRNTPEFAERRREWGTQEEGAEAELAQRARLQQEQQQQQQPPSGTGPGST